ncbi:type II toxin-antitoxin system RelE/ParE family toxin [Bartonella krasnovii]|uniref:type II toxin-antitoxin system RelE/ParE family toxin n=1 Tax=Bartonella krasnovii TaxID=2267275 RepID=UPI001F4D3295|nr:type II toxin-antitoxin system RelE/ParE family toxin [Bartonella krasnovii]UNF47298.1 type II toxin-antitoxin system RelE/ParE family toxin [Bartonella krasnovii]
MIRKRMNKGDLVIESFADKRCKDLLEGNPPRGFPPTLVRIAQRKLFMLDKAVELKDLRSPPGNRLEALKGERKGQYSIRINDQFRICFEWRSNGAYEVEIVDYH